MLLLIVSFGAFIAALCILWSRVFERSVGVEYWNGVLESDIGVANIGHSFALRHTSI